MMTPEQLAEIHAYLSRCREFAAEWGEIHAYCEQLLAENERLQKQVAELQPAGWITGTEARVCRLIADRQRLGIAKYGVTVADNPLPLLEWLKHQRDELADALVYCQRAIEELEAASDRTKHP